MIELRSVTKEFTAGVRAVDALSLKVEHGRTLALCGTSGCGKTTTLKMMNRLVEPTAGEIFIDGQAAHAEPVEVLRRRIGYVLQNIGLFPHWTVGRNIETVPALLGWDAAKRRARSEELLELVGLPADAYRDRFPIELSGGQRQRVGVARALSADPSVILMDEPFGALDPITRETLQREFIALKARLKKTIVFVTHDIVEAVLVADEIALMDAGQLVQLGPPEEIVHRPANDFVRSFLGSHRFVLELMVAPVRSLLPKDRPAPAPDADAVRALPALRAEQSVLDALNLLKESGATALRIVDADGATLGCCEAGAVTDVLLRATTSQDRQDGSHAA